MRIILIRPADIKNKNKPFLLSPSVHPPIGLLYIGAVLENEGHEVEVLDYYNEEIPREKLDRYLKSADVIGIYVITEDLQYVIDLTDMIKEIASKIPIIIGGPHCTFLPKQSLLDIPNADISVIGEGEKCIIDIMESISGNKKLSDICGIYYRDKNKILPGKPVQVIKDLDVLPFPARHLVEKYNYGIFPFGYKLKEKTTALITSKGCPFNCRFCAKYSNIIDGWSYRKRSVDNIVNEILEISEKYRSVMIVDENFLAEKKRAHKIFDFILENKIDLEFFIEGARVDAADRDLYLKMKKAGVKLILYGLESGNQDVLDYYNKKITLQQIRKAVNLAREMNFFIYASFIFGAPIETHAHIKKTIDFACSLPVDLAMFGPLTYLMGSSLWVEAVKDKKISPNQYNKVADLDNNLGNFSIDELEKYTIEAFRSFYFRPNYVISQIYRSILRNDYSLLLNGWKFFPLINKW